MPRVKRLRVGVLYGGRSGEHEVSLASAASVLRESRSSAVRSDRAAHRKRRAVGACGSAAIGHVGGRRHRTDAHRRRTRPRRPRSVSAAASRRRDARLVDCRPRRADADAAAALTGLHLDVVFPVLHGPYGEDGTIQGAARARQRRLRRLRRPGLVGRAWTRR